MKNTIIILFLIISGCSNIEFVYAPQFEKNILKENTSAKITGDDANIIKNFLNTKISLSNTNPEFDLIINSKKEISNLVTNNNQTTTHYEIKHILSYQLYKINSKIDSCLIIEREETTKSDYVVKSDGYNFGSETNKKNVIKKNIESNVSVFLETVELKFSTKNC